MIEQRVTLRYGAQQIPAIVQAVQGDTGRDVIFELADYEIPTGATANYYIDKTDGNAIYNSAEVISSTEILAHLTEQALAAPGRNNGQVRILSDGEVITSFDFVLEVAAFRGILHMQSETEINIFDQAIEDAVNTATEEAVAEIQAQTPVVTGMQNSIAPTYSSSNTYAIGDYVMYNAQLYKCISPITTAEAWTSAHWTQVSAASDLKSALDEETNERINAFNNAFVMSPNLLDESALVVGYLSNGVVLPNYTTFRTSDYIPVEPGDKVRAQYTDGSTRRDSGDGSGRWTYTVVNYYDSNKAYITGSGQNNQSVITVPDNAYFVRFTLVDVLLDVMTDIMIIDSEDSTLLPYSAYGEFVELKEDKIPTSYDEHIKEIIENFEGYKISPYETTFFYISKNMIDPSICVDGEFVNQINGTFNTASGQRRTGYIAVSPQTQYVLRTDDGSRGFRYFFYNSAKAPINGSGALMPGTNDMLITSPADAAFIAISDTDIPSKWMLAKYENGNKSFESYDNVFIQPKYIHEDLNDLIINLPSTVYALVGYELNIYFENLVENWEKYFWDVTCEKGQQLERGYRIVPVSGDVGSYTLTFRVHLSETVYKEISTTLVITSTSTGSGVSKKVIILGDSTTDNGIAVTKLNENFSNDVMNISTLGTRGTSPNNHEGRSGWRFSSYFNPPNAGDIAAGIENPFYNPTTETFDASYYFTNTGIEKPDWFFINLGINDVFGYGNDTYLLNGITTILGLCDEMIESIQSASQNTKIGLCLTIPPNHSQDAFGKAYYCGQTRDRYKRNNTIWVSKLIEKYSGKESEGIYLIPIYTNLDTIYNMGMEEIPVNARNASITYQSPIGNGGVHPVESGYWQIADIYTAFLKEHASD